MKVNNKILILNILKKSQNPISGEEVSNKLGISRTAVWKNIQSLINNGYTIVSSSKGYTLKKENDLLIPYEFVEDSDLYIYKETTDSTMDLANNLIKTGKAQNGSVIVTQSQKMGKSKAGTRFDSPTGGLYFTLIINEKAPVMDLNLYPIASLLAIKSSIKDLLNIDVTIKWPFESWLNGKKVSGILHDYITEENKIKWLTIGIGINLGIEIPRRELLINIKSKIFKYMENREELINNYKSTLNIIGKEYSFNIENKKITGKVMDINRLGTLIIKGNNGTEYGYIGNSTQGDLL